MSEQDRFKHLRSSVSGKVPKPDDLIISQLAINFTDKKIYTKTTDGEVISLVGDEPIIVVDKIVKDANTSYPVGTAAKYLVQKQNVAAFSGLSSQEAAKLSRSAHAQQVATLTVTGTPTGGGTYRFLGRSASYVTGQSAINFAGEIATELGFIAGVGRQLKSVTQQGSVLTITWNAFAEQPALPTLNENGLNIATAITTVGGAGDHLWGVIKSNGTKWKVDEVAENINFSIVAERQAPQQLVQLADPNLRDVLPDIKWAKAGQFPTKSNPATATTSDQVHVTPANVKDIVEGITEHGDFAALDASAVSSLTGSNYSASKVFYVTKAGSVQLNNVSNALGLGDTVSWNGSAWSVNKATADPQYHKHTVDQTGHGFITGDVVYFQQSTRSYKKAKADSINTSGLVALVKKVNDNQFEAVFSGFVDGVPGLTIGQTYYVSQTTAGAVTASQPSSGIVKLAFQCIENGTALVLPIIAHDAGSASGGSSLSKQRLIDAITSNKTEGADKFLAGDGTFKTIGNLARLFSTVETAGTLSGASATYPATGKNCDVSSPLNGQMIRAVGITPADAYDITLKDASFVADGIAIIVNQSTRVVTVKAESKTFFVPFKSKTTPQTDFEILPSEFVFLVANQSTSWQVMHSGYNTEIDDNGATDSTIRTYSISKILSSIQALISDGSSSSTSKTWSINKIKSNATFQDRITAGAGQTINSGQADTITINQDVSNKLIELTGVYTNTGFDVVLGTNAWTSGVIMFLNRTSGSRRAALKSGDGKKFARYMNGSMISVDQVNIEAGRMVIISRDVANNHWIVMESGDNKWLDDAASTDSTIYTYSVKKINELVNGVKQTISGLISDSTTSASDKTWSINKIKTAIAGLIDDAAYNTSKTWSSKKSWDENDKIQDHRLLADSFASLETEVHLDAFYRSGMLPKKQSDITAGRNVSSWSGKDPQATRLNLPESLKVSARNASRPGFYSAEFDGTAYGTLHRGSSAIHGTDVFNPDSFTIVAVIRPTALPSVQESDYKEWGTIIHSYHMVTLGVHQFGLSFHLQDDSNGHDVLTLNITGDLNKDMIVIAHKDQEGNMHLHARGDSKMNHTDFLDPSRPFGGADSTYGVEVGRGSNNRTFQGDMNELIVTNGGSIWEDRERYFEYFARKWGIDI